MATINAYTFQIVYPTCVPSRKRRRKTRKTVHSAGAKTPNFLPYFPLCSSISSSTSFRCVMGERLKQVCELEGTLLRHDEGKRKSFSERRAAPKTLAMGYLKFWNLVNQISISIHQEHWEQTMEIKKLKLMKKDSKANAVVEVLRLQTNARKAVKFFQWAGKLEEYEHHPDAYYTVIEILVKSNMLDTTQVIIEQMKNKGVELSLNVFNRLIRRFGECGKIKEALDVFDFIKSEGYIPDTSSYNNILAVLVRGKKLEMAENLYVEMSGYGLVKDARTFTTMINCLCMGNKLGEAKELLQNMLDKGCPPNVVTYTALISGFCKRGKMSPALDIFEKMQEHGCNPNVMTYNSILNGLCFVGRVEEALRWLQKMHNKGCTPNMYSYTCLINGLGKVGRTNEAKELLTEALGRGLTATIVSYNALFDGYFKEGRPYDAMNLFDEISQKGVMPDIITYTTLVHGLVKWRKIPEAMRLQDEIAEKGYKLDFPILNALLQGLWKQGNSKDAHRLFRKMQEMGHVHDPHMYYMVIYAHSLAGEMQEALTCFYEMVRNTQPNHMIYNEVIKEFCINGRLDDAIHILKFMMENGRGPNVTSYNIVLQELCKEDKDVARQLYAAARKRGLFPCYKPGNHVHKRNLIDADSKKVGNVSWRFLVL